MHIAYVTLFIDKNDKKERMESLQLKGVTCETKQTVYSYYSQSYSIEHKTFEAIYSIQNPIESNRP